MDNHFKTRENKVEGCVSQFWVRAYLDAHQNVVFEAEADSDSVLTKGLAALLVQGLSGLPAEVIVTVSPYFVVLLGLLQSLTPSRNNGFLNMLKLMQKKAVEAEKGRDGGEPRKGGGFGEFGFFSGEGESNWLGRRAMRIKEVLERELRPLALEPEDISYLLAGHAGVRGSGDGETHFNVKVVSSEFEAKSLVKRHRLIHGLLQEELQNGLHALSIVAKTPSEAEAT